MPTDPCLQEKSLPMWATALLLGDLLMKRLFVYEIWKSDPKWRLEHGYSMEVDGYLGA